MFLLTLWNLMADFFMDNFWQFALYAGAFLLSVLSLVLGRRLALHLGFCDKPGGRKQHTDPVPPIGGLIIMPVFFMMLWAQGYVHDFWPILAGAGAILVMGAIDDGFRIPAWGKFFIQIWVACFVVIFGHAELYHLGNLMGLGPVDLGVLGKPFAVICLVMLMNALNMMDGLDGLAGGFSAIVLAVLLGLCFVLDDGAYHATGLILLSLLMPVLGFLIMNIRSPFRQKAAVFLGDSGSLTLGLVIGYFAIILSQSNVHYLGDVLIIPMAAAWIIALPVLDTLALFVMRLSQSRHPFDPDRQHLHHRFVDNGVPTETAVPMILLISLLCAGIGVVGAWLEISNIGGASVWMPCLLFILWVCLFAVHLLLTLRPSMWINIFKACGVR